MAQSFTQQQLTWLTGYATLLKQLSVLMQQISDANTVYNNNTYGNGGANALTDATVQTVIPAGTAAAVWGAEGAVTSIVKHYNSNRGYLDAIRQ